MTAYTICAVAVAIGGLAPALWIASHGGAVQRLVGLELVSAIGVVVMLVLAQITDQSFYLAVPLVLAPLSFAGTLVFTRLLVDHRGEQ